MTHSPGVPPAAAPPQRRLLPSCFLAASPHPTGRLCSRPRPCAALLPPFLSLCEHPLACGVGSGPGCCMGGATTLRPTGCRWWGTGWVWPGLDTGGQETPGFEGRFSGAYGAPSPWVGNNRMIPFHWSEIHAAKH